MQDNLVIVESPAKAKTIENFLGKDYKVMSSYGHIRDLKRKEISIDLNSLQPNYEIPEEKIKLVNELKKAVKQAKKVWLASDEDREGEAISWHLCEVLGLSEEKTNRIVFHEITKPAILNAIQTPRHINMNLVNAQQARRILDRLVGFKLSPVLWRKVKPALSAGRVQSVAVRLIAEREREIQKFKAETYYKINATFVNHKENKDNNIIAAELDRRFKTQEEADTFLEKCKNAQFNVISVAKKPLKRMPAPPFTTSTLQQEAARKLGFTVSQTMIVAQKLYENGHITYMRTDSVNLSKLCLEACKTEITKLFGDNYCQTRSFHTHTKGAQEAHEAIRPTHMQNNAIEATQQEKRLYNLIWKRTIASQMAEAQIEKTNIDINISTTEEKFIATGEVIIFDGFIKVYKESTDDEENNKQDIINLPELKQGDSVERKDITATQKFSQSPSRYTEAGLVHKMEELGIGRPSTYAPTISTIQQREYVKKGDKQGQERKFIISTLCNNQISVKEKTEIVGKEKGKLIPTDIGMVVNDFLMENFPNIMDYNFTAKVEQQFDKIAEGQEKWNDMMKNFYDGFKPNVEQVMNARAEHKAGERLLGEEPKTNKPVFVKIGRFGPVVQIGSANDKEKPKFAQIPQEKSIETISLKEALELFNLPKELGEYEGNTVTIGTGRFGPYVLHNKKYVSIPKNLNPISISLDKAIKIIEEKRKQEKQKLIKEFEQDDKIQVLNGRYGPYIAYNGKNYRMPKTLHSKAENLTYEECMDIVNNNSNAKHNTEKQN